MTSTKIVKTSVNVILNSPHDYIHPDDLVMMQLLGSNHLWAKSCFKKIKHHYGYKQFAYVLCFFVVLHLHEVIHTILSHCSH